MIDLRLGNCLEVMKALPDNSVDAIVCDPPYGLSFMGKKWDYDVPSQEIWEEALRVLKPGGYLLSFAGTRTQHRMAVRIEDAGFEIRDMIFWTYASGFPKSLNIFKQLSKRCTCGNMEAYDRATQKPESDLRPLQETDISQTISNQKTEREVLQSELQEQDLQIQQSESTKNVWEGQPSMEGRSDSQENSRELSGNHLPEMSKRVSTNGEEGRIHNATQASDGTTPEQVINQNGGSTPQRPQSQEQSDREPCAFCKQYRTQAMGALGLGSALKPACEPITVARKPISEKNLADNYLKWGVGGIDIDGSRVEYKSQEDFNNAAVGFSNDEHKQADGWNMKANGDLRKQTGRFPANLIHDGSDEVVGLFPNTKTNSTGKNSPADYNTKSVFGAGYKSGALPYSGDSGSAARFFYCAKSSKAERNRGCEGMEDKIGGGLQGTQDGSMLTGSGNIRNNVMKNNHPTVKPVALMEYLVKLVSREDAVVLDPFMGSGSTGIACRNLKRNFIGIEMSEEYLNIAKARINSVHQEKML